MITLEPQIDYEKAKQADIFDLWMKLELPGDPASSCKSPFRSERNASFWISEDHRRWKDFGTGEGGDSTDFVAKALSISLPEAAKYIIENNTEVNTKQTIKVKSKPLFPDLSKGHEYDWKELAKIRSLQYQTILDCVELGLVRFLDYENVRCWCITDDDRLAAQVRKLDGTLFENGAKAITLKGSWASWPVGIGHEKSGIIWLCEGGPDLLAAREFANKLGFKIGIRLVTMLGAGQVIQKESLKFFAHSKVLIMAHNDKSGHEALDRWSEQLANNSLKTIRFNYHNRANDLNDLLLLPEGELIFKQNCMRLN